MLSVVDSADDAGRGVVGAGDAEGVGEALRGVGHDDAGAALRRLPVQQPRGRGRQRQRARDHERHEVKAELQY